MGTHHPGGVRICGIQTEDTDGGVGHTLEAPKNHLGLDRGICVFSSQKGTVKSTDGPECLFYLFDDGGSACSASDLTTFGRLGCFSLVDDGPLTNIRQPFNTVKGRIFKVFVGDIKVGAVDTHRIENALNVF